MSEPFAAPGLASLTALMVPEPIGAIKRLMGAFDGHWSLCGGWALDAWLGYQTREHLDVDVAIFREDERRIFEQLADWHLVAHDTPEADHSIPWDGRRLKFPAHLHAEVGLPKREIQLNERHGDEWILHREPRVVLPVERFALPSAWDVPLMAPEAILFYKAIQTRRPHDEADFAASAPVLKRDEREWLLSAVRSVDHQHPWLAAVQAP